MKCKNRGIQMTSRTADPSMHLWRWVQTSVWFLGLALLLSLWFWPRVGLHLFWNVLIPVAPALLALAPGVWRNVCPLGTTSLLPRHLGFSREWKLSTTWNQRLGFLGFLLLL